MENTDVRITKGFGLTRKKRHRVPVQQLASSVPGLLA